jgi:branched-chain amino acid transport system ATP-binding protein
MTMSALLETRALSAFYGDFQALFGIDVTVAPGEVIALIGSNGAGKSTFLKSVAGLLRPRDAGQILYRGEPVGGAATASIVGKGIALVPEGRRLFASLTVEENLLLGAYSKRPGRWNLQSVYALFPALQARRQHAATALSGGQQQMVAIGRALMSNPDLLMCDELSLGLAPVIVREIYAALPAIVADGMSAIVVEQDVQLARRVSSRFYCFQEGRVSLAGVSAEVSDEAITQAYFGAVA